jgi:hypothetical protein
MGLDGSTDRLTERTPAAPNPSLILHTYKLRPICTHHRYFDRTQIKEDEENREYWFRHISKGACVLTYRYMYMYTILCVYMCVYMCTHPRTTQT